MFGAYIADNYLGRYKTIMISIACTIIGHVILTVGAAPSVLVHPKGALAAFIIAIIVFGLGIGGSSPISHPLSPNKL